jgi:hypothetical protein
MVYAFGKQLEIEKYIVLSVRHRLDYDNIMPFEKITLQLQPIIFMGIAHV